MHLQMPRCTNIVLPQIDTRKTLPNIITKYIFFDENVLTYDEQNDGKLPISM